MSKGGGGGGGCRGIAVVLVGRVCMGVGVNIYEQQS
jgi:hypothetical protein